MIETEYEPKRLKKTNYRRLWREAKRREVVAFNFAGDIVDMTKRFIKDEKDLAAWSELVSFLRDKYKKI